MSSVLHTALTALREWLTDTGGIQPLLPLLDSVVHGGLLLAVRSFFRNSA